MRKFNKNRQVEFIINKDDEKSLFKNGIIVFDTSALLSFYFFPTETVKEISNNILSEHKSRLWIPSHVEYEFLKNRETVAEKPLRSYESLISQKEKDDGHLNEIKNSLNQTISSELKRINGQLKTLSQKTHLKNRHPYLDSKMYEKYKKELKQFEQAFSKHKKEFEKFFNSFDSEIKKRMAKVKLSIEKDIVLQEFEKYLTVGKEYSFDRIEKIIEEGKERYANEIPPGYKDEETKSGMQIYGDLIVWNQIIDHAKENYLSIVFVTEDNKEDWWYLPDDDSDPTPRHELLIEFKTKTGENFWMYSVQEFLHKANIYLSSKIKKSTIQDVVESNRIKFKQIELEWLEVLSDALDSGEDVMPNHNYVYKGKRLGTWLSNVSQYNRKNQKLDTRRKIEELGFDYSLRSHDPDEIALRFIEKLLDDPNPIKGRYQTHFNTRVRDKKARISPEIIQQLNQAWESVFNEKRLWTKVNLTQDNTAEWKRLRYDTILNPDDKWFVPARIAGDNMYTWIRRRKINPKLFHEIQHKFTDKELEELISEGFQPKKYDD